MLYGVELQEGLIIIDDYDKVSKIDKKNTHWCLKSSWVALNYRFWYQLIYFFY